MIGKTELLQSLIGSALESHPNLLADINAMSDGFADQDLPWLDQEKLGDFMLNDYEQKWRNDGVLILDSFMPEDLIDTYKEAWVQHNRVTHDRPMGYPGECAYSQVPSLMEIATYAPLHRILESLIGDQMGIHLNLTGWKSTTRNWHQDGYLNPDSNKDHYLAVWVALDDIHEDSGPFEFVRGSHVLPTLTQEATKQKIPVRLRDDPSWPKYSEEFLTPMFDDIITRGNLQKEQFIAKKGDVLIWHARLMHRGTVPNNPDLWREAVILHYSGVNHRPDMPQAVQHNDGGWYFPINQNIEL
jgi:hypothetical protein